MAKKNAVSQNPNTGKKTTVDIMDKTMTIVENAQKTKIPLNNKQIAEILYGKKINLRCKNVKQKDLVKAIDQYEIILSIGPAGVGKSFVSVAKALELLAHPDTNYQKIYIVTPNVEADESEIGFLPGDLEEKLKPYLFSTYYLMDKLIGKENRIKLQQLNIIEPLAFGFLRGVNIDNSILVCEEAQNTSVSQMKTLLTRIGFNSKFIISGDLEQTDTKIRYSGLEDAVTRFKNFESIGIVSFTNEEIVRNPIISGILNRYNEKLPEEKKHKIVKKSELKKMAEEIIPTMVESLNVQKSLPENKKE